MGILAREVYKNETQHANEDDLIFSIEFAGKNLSRQSLTGFSESMTGRLLRVIEKKK